MKKSKYFHRQILISLNALIIVLTVGVLPACSVNPATGERRFTAFMSPEKEKEIGAQEHPKIIKQFNGAYDDVELAAYIAEIGFYLTSVSELPNDQFTFTVLNDDVVNAFALPGGYVYVSRGLIALAENEAELAGVIAHEIGHVTARHTAERYSKTMAANIGLSIIGIIGSVYGAPRQATDILSSGASSILRGYSREQELEADMLGVRYIARAGYDPKSMATFFQKMKGHDELQSAISGQPSNEENYNHASTHPRTTDRINQAIKLARGTIVENPKINTGKFLSKIDGMIFGDDPEQGIRRGRTFMHPDLRFEFTVPDGFQLYNSPNRVTARHQNGSRIIFTMEDTQVSQKVSDLRKYLIQNFGENQKLRAVELLDINGMEAWTGFFRQNSDSGPRDYRLIVIKGDDGKIFRLFFITPLNLFDAMAKDLRRMTYSFRRLTVAEAEAIRPLRINITDATQNQTSQSMTEGMNQGEFSRQWFELLNMVALQDGLQDGERVKLIGE